MGFYFHYSKACKEHFLAIASTAAKLEISAGLIIY